MTRKEKIAELLEHAELLLSNTSNYDTDPNLYNLVKTIITALEMLLDHVEIKDYV